MTTRSTLFAAALPGACLAQLGIDAAAQQQWTVDDSGGADFTSLQAAVDAAEPGDVLLIYSGSYGGVQLNKTLRLLRPPAAPGQTLPRLAFLDIAGAPAFTLAQLDIQRLRAVGVPQRAALRAHRSARISRAGGGVMCTSRQLSRKARRASKPSPSRAARSSQARGKFSLRGLSPKSSSQSLLWSSRARSKRRGEKRQGPGAGPGSVRLKALWPIGSR